MRSVNLSLRAIALWFAIFFVGIGTGVAIGAQGHMLNARSYLNDAIVQLDLAIADKAGHRAQAIQYTKDAINQINLGIAAGAR